MLNKWLLTWFPHGMLSISRNHQLSPDCSWWPALFQLKYKCISWLQGYTAQSSCPADGGTAVFLVIHGRTAYLCERHPWKSTEYKLCLPPAFKTPGSSLCATGSFSSFIFSIKQLKTCSNLITRNLMSMPFPRVLGWTNGFLKKDD